MRLFNKKHLGVYIVSCSLLLNVSFLVATAIHWNYVRPLIVKFIKPYLRPMTEQHSEDLRHITEYIESQAFSSESEKIDFVRNWVNKNSVVINDREHDEYAFNTPRVLSMLWNTHNTAKDRPHLSCGPRALAMSAILDKLEIQNRLVMIFTDDNPQVNSHTFLEVLNKDTKRWELQDPDFNIYYIDSDIRKRVATCRLVFGDLDSITPVSPSGEGWKNNNVEHLKLHFFEAMMFMNHLQGETSVVLVNTDRFDSGKVFEKNGNMTFYQFANKYYGHPIFVHSQGF